MKRYTLTDNKTSETSHYTFLQFNGSFWIMWLLGFLTCLLVS